MRKGWRQPRARLVSFHSAFRRSLAAHRLPAPVHPVPLLRARENEPLEGFVVGTRVRADRVVRVVALDRCERVFEAQHVMAVGFAPARGRQHGRTGRERNDREALERPRRMSEEVDLDAVRRARVLVERKDNHVAGRQRGEDRIERTALWQHAEARLVEAAGDEGIEPLRLYPATPKIKNAAASRAVYE